MRSPRRPRGTAAAVAGSALALAACTTEAGDAGLAAPTDDGSASVTLRVWDAAAARAYAESFDAFMTEQPDIRVEVEVVPRAEYWDRVETDLAAGEMADLFWADGAGYARYAEEGALVDVGAALGDEHDEWVGVVTDLFSRDGTVWGVPQLWDPVALYYDVEMVESTGVDVEELTWAPAAGAATTGASGSRTDGDDAGEDPPTEDPTDDDPPTDGGDPPTEDTTDDGDPPAPDDTLLDAARALTTDSSGRRADDEGFDPAAPATYGFDAQGDLLAIAGSFLAQNDAALMAEGEFAFASARGEQTFGYLVDMVTRHRTAPPVVAGGPSAVDQFTGGRLALLQSGAADLRAVAESARGPWALAPLVAGPEGRVAVVDGVAAVGNAATEDEGAAVAVLRWLGSADGQAALAGQGVAPPATVGATDAFVEHWSEQGVDVAPFFELDAAVPAPSGPRVRAGLAALTPVLGEMYVGLAPVPAALARAQDAANTAMEP
ncbi:extracellular solute-binding protein [Georgenia muralis]|uniref:Multiple sugar transport system substrate-binding protein n=1 Tax=Georgenia muralis TaxID=154117 RepID=A0A3N4ZMA1_9MICO|nr:extracellular solute-binding protein [Georgenia muralis]RPF26832.1 multiple sugar transport system substrate-binding protein [Georgenia muralis]